MADTAVLIRDADGRELSLSIYRILDVGQFRERFEFFFVFAPEPNHVLQTVRLSKSPTRTERERHLVGLLERDD